MSSQRIQEGILGNLIYRGVYRLVGLNGKVHWTAENPATGSSSMFCTGSNVDPVGSAIVFSTTTLRKMKFSPSLCSSIRTTTNGCGKDKYRAMVHWTQTGPPTRARPTHGQGPRPRTRQQPPKYLSCYLQQTTSYASYTQATEVTLLFTTTVSHCNAKTLFELHHQT